jgi:prepilin-type processing-associated H-X9-DG protein
MAHCDEALVRMGKLILRYQEKHEGKNPATLEELLDGDGLTAWDLVCPASSDGAGGCSYVYRGSDLYAYVPDEMILAYDREAWHKGRRNVLFAGGNVKRPLEEAFEKAIEKDNQYRRSLELEEKR